jgi:uncharacterized metal-binding protein
VRVLQLFLSPLQLLLEHRNFPGQVLSGSLVSITLVCSVLVALQTGLSLVQAGLSDFELTLEGGDELFLIENGLLGLESQVVSSI